MNNFSQNIILAVVSLILIVLFICYKLFYKKIINKKIQNAESTAHVSIFPTESVEKIIIIIWSAVFVISTLAQLSEIKNATYQVNNELNNQINSLSAELNEIQEELKVQNSLFSDFSVEYGEVNTFDNTVKTKFICTPKSYSKDTKITIHTKQKNYDFVFDSIDGYTAECNYPLFEPSDKAFISVETNGITNTVNFEEVGIYSAVYTDALPYIKDISISLSDKGSTSKYRFNAEKLLNDSDFSDVQLVIYINGKESERINVTQNICTGSLNNSDCDFIIEAKDKYGYIHKSVVLGHPEHLGATELICDSDGNVLYTID